MSTNVGGLFRLRLHSLIGFIHQDIKCANIVVDEFNNIRIIDLENAEGTEGWAHPDDLRGYLSYPLNDGIGPDASMYSIGGDYAERDSAGISHCITEREHRQVSEDMLLRFPHSCNDRTLEQKQRFAVYGFGKAVWELYVRGEPVNEDDLRSTPGWVQDLFLGCCMEEPFASLAEVLKFLESHSEL